MAASERYITMAAVLDDPLNRAIAARELARRSRPLDRGLCPPPIPKAGGGCIFLTMREYQRNPVEVCEEVGPAVDFLADVFQGSDGWWVGMPDGAEAGPFSNLRVATNAAADILTDDGFEVLSDPPWTAEDGAAYPFTAALL